MFDENAEDAEIVIQECEMHRYRPGIQKDFIPRWIQLTSKNFRCFENEYRASMCKKNPCRALQSIPIKAIRKAKEIEKGTFEISRSRSFDQQKKMHETMFEI